MLFIAFIASKNTLISWTNKNKVKHSWLREWGKKTAEIKQNLKFYDDFKVLRKLFLQFCADFMMKIFQCVHKSCKKIVFKFRTWKFYLKFKVVLLTFKMSFSSFIVMVHRSDSKGNIFAAIVAPISGGNYKNWNKSDRLY